MRPGPFITVLLAAVALSCAPRVCAHPGQSMDVRITVDGGGVTMNLLVSADLMYNLLQQAGLDPRLLRNVDVKVGFSDPELEKKARAALTTIFAHDNELRINGEPEPYRLAWFEAVAPSSAAMVPGENPPDIRLMLEVHTEELPREVAIDWTVFPQDMSRAAFGLPTTSEVVAWLKTPYEDTVIVFTKDEPEYIWHEPQDGLRAHGVPTIAAVKRPVLPIPVVSVGVVLGWLVVVVVVRRSPAWPRLRRRVVWSALPVVGVAAGAVGVWQVGLPMPWKPACEPPSEAEALTIFESLQRNIYGAFEQLDEEGVYDVLAKSVDGDLLDEVYNEVYQSLILRDEGGVVARIKGVEILDAELDSSGVLGTGEAVAFNVRSRWRVHGAVYHWGHVHSRTNEYQALFTVAQCGGNWRITAINDMEQQRIPMPGDDPEIDALGARGAGS